MRGDGRKGRPVPVGQALRSLLGQLGLDRRMAERKLIEAWPQVVGEKIASHSRAIDIEDGVLTMQADHPVWRQELTLLVPEIVAEYNRRFGEGAIREIRWDRRLPQRPRSDNRG